MDVGSLLKYVVIIFPLSEITLLVFKRSKERSSSKRDRGSLRLLWLTIIASISLTVVLQWYPSAAFQLPRSISSAFAFCFLTGGLIIRWLSIISLGKFFTVDVAIQEEHILVLRGLYKYIRHPSYTGLLTEFIGLAVYFGTWVSLIIIVVPITSAIVYRIRCEEIVLLEKFGKHYEEYMTHTKSLIPGIV
jgi:protein-S-isoprenylcysteine O-methyltransferase Ste14